MRFTKVLITGCGGMLGSAIYPSFLKLCPEVLATDLRADEPWLEKLDVRDRATLEAAFRRFRPDLVLHLAAETNLEFCETNADVAQATNADATRQVAELSTKYDATLVYISTAGVFDGEKDGLYTEEDAPNPIMVYGQTKLEGEDHVREYCDKYYVIRAGWMVGGGRDKDHKFTSKILGQLAAGSRTLRAVADKWGTPTYTQDFAKNLWLLLRSGKYGTYHMVCEGHGTRWDVAREIVKICGRSDVTVKKVASKVFDKEYFAPRPRSEMMLNRNLTSLGLNTMRPWKTALSEYIHREFPELLTPPVRPTGGEKLRPGVRGRSSRDSDILPQA